MKKTAITSEGIQNAHQAIATQFKITRSAIEEMYRDDKSIPRNVNQNTNASTTIGNLTIDSFNTNYFNINNLELIRGYSREAYAFYPIYSTVIDTLSNMYLWRYVFYPRLVKEKKSGTSEYEEIYKTMAEVVDGVSIETTFPGLLSKLLVDGSLFLTTTKRQGSKTVTTLILPPQYCRLSGKTQFGTNVFQFDFSYFDSLGLNKEQLDIIFTFYPQEMKSLYDAYTEDNNLRWQKLNPKFSAGFVLNDQAFPTYLRSLGAIKQYDQYRGNELERSDQQLLKIISHKMPTWEDKLVVEIPEMTALHKSMAKTLTKNKYVRMLTTFGDLDVLSIGDDQSKENKTLQNAYASIYNVVGDNENLFNGSNKEALEFSLRRKESIIWKHIQELVGYYNLVINNQFNFKGYQCSLNMLPLTIYNFKDSILQFKEGATLGTSKLEYIVGLGTKQIDIPSKVELEDFLKLDELTPLSTSYTGGKNAAGIVKEAENNSEEKRPADINAPKQEDDKNKETTEVQNEEV